MGDKSLSNKSSEKRSCEKDVFAEPVSKRLRRYKDELKLTVNKETEASSKELNTKKNCLRSQDNKIIQNDSKTSKIKDNESNSTTKAGLRKSKKCDLEKEIKEEKALSEPKIKSVLNDKKQKTSNNDNFKKNKYSTQEKNNLSLHNIKKSMRFDAHARWKINDKLLILPTKKGSPKNGTMKKETSVRKQTTTNNFRKKKKQSTQGNVQLIIGKKINKCNYKASVIKRMKNSRPTSKSGLQYVTVKNTNLLSNITPEKQIILDDDTSKNIKNFTQDSQNTQIATRSTSLKSSFVKNESIKSRNKTITSKKEGNHLKTVNQENGQIPVKVPYIKNREGAKNNRTRRKNELHDDSLETSEINLVTDAPMSIINLPYYNASKLAMDASSENISFATNSENLHHLVDAKNSIPHSIKKNQHEISQARDTEDIQNDFEFAQTSRGIKNRVNYVKTDIDLLFQKNELNISAGIQKKHTDAKSVESVITSNKPRASDIILSDWSTSENSNRVISSEDSSLPNVSCEEPGTTVNNKFIGPSSESSIQVISSEDSSLPNVNCEESGTTVNNRPIGPISESSIHSISSQDSSLPNVNCEEPGTTVNNWPIGPTSESSIYVIYNQYSSLPNVNCEEPGTTVNNQSFGPISESSIHSISNQDSSLPNDNCEESGTTVNNRPIGPISESSIHSISSQDSSLPNDNCEEPETTVNNRPIGPTSESSIHSITSQDSPLPNVNCEEPGTTVNNRPIGPISESSIHSISSQDSSLPNDNCEEPGTTVNNRPIGPISESSIQSISSQDSSLPNVNCEEPGTTVNKQSFRPISESSIHSISNQDSSLPNDNCEESGTTVNNRPIGPTLESSIHSITSQDTSLPNVNCEEPGTIVNNRPIGPISESSIHSISSQDSSLPNVNCEEPGTTVNNQSFRPISESSIHSISNQDSSLPNDNCEEPGTTVNNRPIGPISESSIHYISSQDSSLPNDNCEEPGTTVNNRPIGPISESSIHSISSQDSSLPNVNCEEPGTTDNNQSFRPTSESSIHSISNQDSSLPNVSYEDPGTTVNNRYIGLLTFHNENSGVENVHDHNSESLSEIIHCNICSHDLFTQEKWKSDTFLWNVCSSIHNDRNGIVESKYREFLEKGRKNVKSSALHIIDTLYTEIVDQKPHGICISPGDSSSDSDSWEYFKRRPSKKNIYRIVDDSDHEDAKIKRNKKKFMISKFVKNRTKNKKSDKAVKYSNSFCNPPNSNQDSSKTIIDSFERQNVPEIYSLNGSEEGSAIAMKSKNFANGTVVSEIKAPLYKGKRASEGSSKSQNEFMGFDYETPNDIMNYKETELYKKSNVKESCILNSIDYISDKNNTLENFEIEPNPIAEKCVLMLHNQNDLLNTNQKSIDKFFDNKDHLSVPKFSELSDDKNLNVKCEIDIESIYNSTKTSSHKETCITEDNYEIIFTGKARSKPTNHPNLNNSLISDDSSIVVSEIFTGDSNKKNNKEKIGINPNKISKENSKEEEDLSCFNKTCFDLNNSVENVQNKSKSLIDNDASMSSEHNDLIDLNLTSNDKFSDSIYSEEKHTLINKISSGKTEKIKSKKQSKKSLKISGSDHLSNKEENLSLDKSELLPSKIIDQTKDVNVSSIVSKGLINYKTEEINRKENVEESNTSNCMDSASALSLTNIQTKICPEIKNDISVLSEQFDSIKIGKKSIVELCNDEILCSKNDNSSVSKHSDSVNAIVKCESIIKSNNLPLKEDVFVLYDPINYKLKSKNKLPNKLLSSQVETIKNKGLRTSSNNSHFEKIIKLDEHLGSKENTTIISNVTNEENNIDESHTSYSKQNYFFPSKCIQKFPSVKANKVNKISLRKNKSVGCERMYNTVTAKLQKKVLLKEYRKRISERNTILFNNNLNEGIESENKLINENPVKEASVVISVNNLNSNDFHSCSPFNNGCVNDYEENCSSLNSVPPSQEKLIYSAGGLRCNQRDEIGATHFSKTFKNTNVMGLQDDKKLSSTNMLSDECSIQPNSSQDIPILKPVNTTLEKVKSQNEGLLEKYFKSYCIKNILTNSCKPEDHCKNIHDIPIGFLDGFPKEEVELLIKMVIKHSTLISTSFLFEVLCFFVQHAAQMPILSLSGRVLSKIFMKSKTNKRYLREVSNYIFDALHDCGILRPEAMALLVNYNRKFFSTCALEDIYCIFEEWDLKSAVLYPIWPIIKPLIHRDGLSLSEEIVIKLMVEVKDSTHFDCIQFCATQLLLVPETTLSILSNAYLENFIKKLFKVGLRKQAKRLSKKIPAPAQITEGNSHMDIPPTDSMKITQEPSKEPESHIEILNIDHNTEICENILVAVKFKQYQQLIKLIIECLEKNMNKFIMKAVFNYFNEDEPLIMTERLVSEFSRNSKFNKFSVFCSSLICSFILYFSESLLWEVSHGFICLFERFKLERYKLQEFIDKASPIRLALVYSEVYFYNGRYKESINAMNESFLLFQSSNYELKKENKVDYYSQQELLRSYLSEYLNSGPAEFGAQLFNLILEKQHAYSSEIDLSEYFEVLANHLFVSNKRDERPLDFYIALSKIKYFPLFGLTVRVLIIMAFRRGDWNTVTRLFDEALACGAYPDTLAEKFTIMLVKSFTEEEMICYLVEWFINFKKTYAQEYRSLYEYFSSNENESPTFSIRFKEENLLEFLDHKSLSIPPILREVDESVEGCTVRLISVLKIVNLKLACRENTLFIKNDMYFKAFLKKI